MVRFIILNLIRDLSGFFWKWILSCMTLLVPFAVLFLSRFDMIVIDPVKILLYIFGNLYVEAEPEKNSSESK